MARALGEAPRTLARWVRRYRDHGLVGLRERAVGRPRRLTRQQLAEIRGAVAGAAITPWTGAALAAWIEARFGVRLCDRQAGRLLSGADGVVKSPAAPVAAPRRKTALTWLDSPNC